MIKSEGLLWMPYEAEKFVWEMRQAARRFREKFKVSPNVCRMHAADIPEDTWTVASIRIIPDETITPGHWFLTNEVLE